MKKIVSLFVFPALLLGMAFSAEARDNLLSGGVITALDFDDRNNRGDVADDVVVEDEKTTRFVISPFIRITSTAERDAFEVYYAPGFSWNLEESDYYTNHDLSLTAHRFVTRQWRMSFSDIYAFTDDSGATSGVTSSDAVDGDDSITVDPDSDLSGDAGRRRYQTNRLNILSEYTYIEDSVFSLGYTFSILKNEDTGIGGYEDYDRHEGYLGLSYRLDPQWKVIFDGRFMRGLFDPPDLGIDDIPGLSSDLKEYRVDLTLESDVFPHDPLYLLYGYIGTKFDEELRYDSDVHQLTLGWQREFSPRMTFGLGGGPSYEKTEGSKGTSHYNAHMDFTYIIEHGSLTLGAAGGLDQNNFGGTNQRGTVEFWELNGSFTYALTQNLSGTLFGSYEEEDREDVIATGADIGLQEYNIERYTAGADIRYDFMRYYFATASYTYTNQDSERLRSDYDEHRIYLSLGVEKDFFRW